MGPFEVAAFLPTLRRVSRSTDNPWLHRFAVLTALATLGLIGVGGLVTSKGAGLAVPDWPTSYDYNMFFFPIRLWKGGVFFEHVHRLFASGVGLLTTVLMVWLWLKESRSWLRWLGVAAFVGVVLQGVLGGLRVIWLKDELGIFHAALAQSFLVLVSALALFTSRWWQHFCADADRFEIPTTLRRLFLAAALVIFAQLIIAATMRHQHAGLAISDFPLAYGKLWPDTSATAIAHYNQQRVEVEAANPITALQVNLQMIHRLVAFTILGLVAFAAGSAWKRLGGRHPAAKLTFLWAGLIIIQVGLGAWTIWSNKAADITTLHVVVGASSLVVGSLLTVVAFCGAKVSSEKRIAPRPELEIGEAFSARAATVLK